MSAQQPVAHPPALWRNRDFLLLWSGQAVSSIGTQVSQLAFPLLILALTGSPAQAGFIGGLRILPYVLLSLPVGALIDRWNRKRVMILCDAGRALSLASIPVAVAIRHLSVAQLYVVALAEGTLYVFFNLAEVASLPRVVPQEQLPAATAQNEAMIGTSFLLGPALGGALYSLGRLFPFLADAVSYVASVVSLGFIRAEFQAERTLTRRKLWVEVSEGLAWLWRNPLIRYMAFLTGGWNFVGQELLIIVLARQQGASSLTIGIIVGIGGIGGILGALVGPLIQRRVRFGPAIIAMLWLSTLLMPLYAVAPNPLWLGAISAVSVTAGAVYNVVQFSYRLALIPDALQGRVNSVFRLLAFGFQPLGLALTGALLQTIHAGPTVLLLSAWMLTLAVATAVNPHVRHARPLSGLAKQQAGQSG
jgi:MFS family permease